MRPRRRRSAARARSAQTAVFALLALLPLAGCGRDGGDGGATGTTGGRAMSLAVDLYFPGNGTTLVAERRELAVADDPEAQLEALAAAVLAGPETPALNRPLPEGVVLRAVYLAPGGVVYVDLASPDGGEPPAGGSDQERLRVYSLVNTLLLNVAEAKSAVVLWNGVQRPTFSGHLDLSRPLLPDTTLVARAESG